MTFIDTSSLPFDFSVLLFTAISGVIFKLFFSGKPSVDGEYGPASSTIWGYGLTGVSLLGLLFVLFNLVSKNSMELKLWDSIKTMLSSSIPIILTILIISWLVILNMIHRVRINTGKVAPEYSQFSFFSTILIVFQLSVVFKYLLQKTKINIFETENETLNKLGNKINDELSSIIYILTLLNLIFVGMMQIVLQFFSTDG